MFAHRTLSKYVKLCIFAIQQPFLWSELIRNQVLCQNFQLHLLTRFVRKKSFINRSIGNLGTFSFSSRSKYTFWVMKHRVMINSNIFLSLKHHSKKKIGFKSETLCKFCAIKKLCVALIDICLWSLYTLMHNYCHESGRFDVVANSCSVVCVCAVFFFISLYLKYLVSNGKKINLFYILPRWTQSQTKNEKKTVILLVIIWQAVDQRRWKNKH